MEILLQPPFGMYKHPFLSAVLKKGENTRELRHHDLTQSAAIQSVNYRQGKNRYFFVFFYSSLSTRPQDMNLHYSGIMSKM